MADITTGADVKIILIPAGNCANTPGSIFVRHGGKCNPSPCGSLKFPLIAAFFPGWYAKGDCSMRQILIVVLFFLLLIAGCATSSTSNTARTGTEQLLVSNAIDQSLNKVDFSPFAGRNVFLEEKYLECVDKNYVVASIRHRLLRSGARIVPADEADIVLEPRSGGVGTHTSSMFVGVPEIVLPGMLTLPEARFLERKNQKGIAKIGMVAYDAKSKNVLGTGGLALSESDDNNWFFMGIGPYQDGSLREELKDGKKKPAGKSASAIPHTVAFSVPPSESSSSPLHQPGQVRLASGQESEPPAAPVSQGSDAPEWAR